MRKPKTYLLQWSDEAKRWTWREAQATIRGTRSSHRWKAWNFVVIEAAAKRTVDIQDLR